ncbi:MAG: hypothetical protein NUW24_09470 [Anaerolineae bacterium]|nr:hypothetical protein [Anaerolineae bacterium]
MEQYYGMTAELYRAVTALVDDRMKEIRVVRRDFDRLVRAQARTEARVEELAAAQARTERRLEELAVAQARTEARVEELAVAQARTEERLTRLEATVERLAEAQARTEAQLQDLIKVVGVMQNTLAAVKGRQLELTYQQKAGAYFGPLLRRMRVLSPIEIEDDLETHLSPEEFRDLLAVDLLVSGQPRYLAEAPQVWLAVEVSVIVDRYDVERARRRATSLQRAGLLAIPTVAGEDATLGAKEEAETHKVLMLQDGRTFFWDEALAEVLG